MKRLMVFFVATLIGSVVAMGQGANNYVSGEKLKYSLFYGVMDGGLANISLDKTSDGQFHAKATAKTVGMVRWFLDMNDVYESFFDPTTCKPSKSIRDIQENKYKFYDVVTHNHEKNTVTSKKKGEVTVPANTYDIVSALFQMRSKFGGMKYNDTLTTTIYFDNEVYPMQVIFKGKEKVSTKLGTFNALKFQPIVETGRVFRHEDDVRFWVSDDANHIPLRAEFDVLIGSIKCDLIEYSGVQYPLSKVK
ncbi:MAG: DUF3108 domain-containing protein [Bacteroidales bacterium]|nr:DUF3108 domain-containing protein [Bacteroidales bacterium]